MIRLLLRLMNIRDYEDCKSCEVLKAQLAIANAEKKEMMDTLLNLIKPKVYEAPPIEVPPMKQQLNTFTQRRASLEKAHEVRRDIRERSPFIVQNKDNVVKDVTPTSVEQMEKKLGLNDAEAQATSNPS